MAYLLFHADTGLLHATWADYHPAFALDAEGVIFALVIGAVVWILFLVLWMAAGRMLRPPAVDRPVGSAAPR
jgi:hypothetical protein